MYSYLFGLFIPTIILNLTNIALYYSTLNAATLSQIIMGAIIMCVLLALGIVAYIKQRS